MPQRDGLIIGRAIECFVRGFSFTRSFTHPYLAERVGPLWVVRDGPRKHDKDYRNEEWIAHGVSPAQVDRVARKQTRGRLVVCAICAMNESEQPLREGYKSLGYRLRGTEPFMVHRLAKIPNPKSPAVMQRVTNQEIADRLAKAARSKQILPKHLSSINPLLRQYVATIDDQIVGWVRSIVVDDMTWCSNMHVEAKFRRQGIARAMMCRMLRDDRAHGAKMAALSASHTGAKLYNAVGYEQIGTLLVFMPKLKK
jgi:GNAT superfamily N-acetyltransferase